MLIWSKNLGSFSDDENTEISVKETQEILSVGDDVTCRM